MLTTPPAQFITLCLISIFCFVGVITASNDHNDTSHDVNFEGIRLATTIKPNHYYLTIKTFIPGYEAVIQKDKEFTFEATVRIKLFFQKATDTIILNAYDFNYLHENCYVLTEKNRRIKIKSIITENDKAAFVLESKIRRGFSELVINYNGKIVNGVKGIYSTVFRRNETLKFGVITQFEMNHARTMVPCFDEPSFKAKWTVNVIHPKGTTALSNQIEIGEPEEIGEFLVTKFKTTVLMSSYLLAISISDLKFIEGYSQNGIRMRVWLQESLIDKGNFALNASLKCPEGMEQLYGIPYPMEKIDLIGVYPFENGGMENYGLITFKEKFLTYKEGESDYNEKQEYSAIIVHELSHLWFGNLVTMKWWNEIWLKEGFAAYMEHVGKQFISGGIWDEENTFLITQQDKAFSGDISSIPLQQEYNSTWGILEEQLYHVYEKGASVLWMIRHIVGDGFNNAIRRYLRKHSYGNADHTDLFNEMAEEIPRNLKGPRNEIPLDIHKFAKRWLEQPGYPILFVEELNGTTVRVTQNHSHGYKWDVPIWLQEKNHKLLAWLPFDKDLIIQQHKSNALVLNCDSFAFAKVNYTEKGWNKILKQLKEDHTIYSERTKYRIMSDLFEFSGKSQEEIINTLIPHLVQEKGFLPWFAIATKFFYTEKMVLPQYFIDFLHKEPITVTDDKSYLKFKVKDQQRSIYCHIINCEHTRYVPMATPLLKKLPKE